MLFLSSYSFRAPLFLSSFISLAASETFLFQLTEYVSAPTCVQSCVSAGSVFGVNSYKCNVAEPESCLCSADQGQSSKVSSFAFTCASSACGNNDEASQAAGVWSSYCVANNANPASAGATGAPTAGATAATGGSGGGGSAAATPASGMYISDTFSSCWSCVYVT